MSSGFRVAVTSGDTTKVKAYTLAIAVQMVVLPLLFLGGLSRPGYPPMFPLGALVGGLLFGACMRTAGGCAAGVWHKSGTGSLAALSAVAGMALGAAALEVGSLARARIWLQSVGTPFLGMEASSAAAESLWMVSPLVGLLLFVLLLRTQSGTAGRWSWRRTGIWIGLIGSAAWPLSSLNGRDFGMAVVPGTVDLLARPTSAFVSWDVLFVLGIPLGACLATVLRGPVRLSFPSPRVAARSFVGGLGLGIGASLAAGCTVGHGLSGIPLLAPGSLLTVASIFAGSALVARLGRQ